jgi:hypothetical protein
MALSLGVKSLEIEAGRRYIFEVKVKNGWSCIARRRPVGMPQIFIDLKAHQNILTYLLNSHNRAIFEKLTVPQLVKIFPAFYGTRRFITTFTTARHLSLSSARLMQFMPPKHTSWRSILMLFFPLRMGLSSGLFHSGFPTKTLHVSLPHTCYMASPTPKYFLQNFAILITPPLIIKTCDPFCLINCRIETITFVII